VTNGYLIYVDGIWGDGTETFHSNTVQILVTILSTNISGIANPINISQNSVHQYIRYSEPDKYQSEFCYILYPEFLALLAKYLCQRLTVLQ
jgi:hypothetical protein